MDFFVQKKEFSYYKKSVVLTKPDVRTSNQRLLSTDPQCHRQPTVLTWYSDMGVPRLTRLHQTSLEGQPGLPDGEPDPGCNRILVCCALETDRFPHAGVSKGEA